jgi:non-canonical purine NTP pyrophosphatase (RdgB/HAM1 family)
MDDLVFITGNQGKVDYLAKWLGHPVQHQKIDLEEIQSLDSHQVVEDKARRAYEMVGKPVLVEDVSLSFSAFGGKLPGTLIKWFLTEPGTEGMLKMLEGFSDRRATASIMYGLYDGAQLYTFAASVPGTVPPEVRGTGDAWKGGKSWNSIFIPDGATKTYAEMTDEELKPFSHRALAVQKLAAFLEQHS